MDEVYIFPVIFFAIGFMCLFLALWGLNPKHLGTAVGKLENSKRVMVWSRSARKKVPITNFVYLYEVGSKTYRLKRASHTSRKSLFQRITVVYVKGFPRFGYPEKFPIWLYTLLGILAISAGLVMLWEIH